MRLVIRLLVAAILLALLPSRCVWAQQRAATVSGHAPQYANETLTFKHTTDYIVGLEREVATAKVDKDGNFTCELDLLGTHLVTIELGVYLCYLYVEPGKHYRIGLPPRHDKSEADRLDPFFEPAEFQLRNLAGDSTSVNARIARFNALYASLLDSALNTPDSLRRALRVDSMAARLAAFDTLSRPPYLAHYQRYRHGLFLRFASRQKSLAASDTYFRNQPILYENPAYMDLLNVVYDRYFVFQSRAEHGRKIFEAITKKRSYKALRKALLVNDNVGDGDLLELIILKGLHDEFFSDNFSRKALTQILDSVLHTTRVPEHAVIATNIRDKVTKLMPGFMPHPIALEDQDGKIVSPEQFRGKLVLLGFCTTTSYTCLQDFAVLERLHKQYGEHLQILMISADATAERVREFTRQTSYPWPFLFYGRQPELIREFDVRAYPTYYLLDTDGKLLYSPAPSPQETLDRLLYSLYRKRGWPVKNL